MSPLLLAAALLSAPASAQDVPAQAPSVIRNPRWLQRPEHPAALVEALMALGPRGSLALTVRCTAQADGTLTDCEARDDDDRPPNRAVASAVQEMVAGARVSPRTVDGAPTASPLTFVIHMYTSQGRSGREIIPVWSEAPTTAQIAAARPAALRDRIGNAQATCGLTEDGRPTRCEIEYERPRNAGVGEAFKTLLPSFRTGSALPDGVNRRNTYVRISLTLPNSESVIDGTQLSRPSWMVTPTEADLKALYPERARAAGITRGQATVDCEVREGGWLGGCRALTAQPADVGFDSAASEIAKLFAVSPWNGGSPTTGRTVRLPFQFVDPAPGAE